MYVTCVHENTNLKNDLNAFQNRDLIHNLKRVIFPKMVNSNFLFIHSFERNVHLKKKPFRPFLFFSVLYSGGLEQLVKCPAINISLLLSWILRHSEMLCLRALQSSHTTNKYSQAILKWNRLCKD